MVINVNIPDSTERMLAEQAAAAELIRKGVSGSRTFVEILAPFRDQVHSSEIQDAELEGLLESARNEVHEAKQVQTYRT